jgi:hypothetical protein
LRDGLPQSLAWNAVESARIRKSGAKHIQKTQKNQKTPKNPRKIKKLPQNTRKIEKFMRSTKAAPDIKKARRA